MLELNPQRRITAEQALSHPYFAHFRDSKDEPKMTEIIDFSFEATPGLKLENIRDMIVNEIAHWNPSLPTMK